MKIIKYGTAFLFGALMGLAATHTDNTWFLYSAVCVLFVRQTVMAGEIWND